MDKSVRIKKNVHEIECIKIISSINNVNTAIGICRKSTHKSCPQYHSDGNNSPVRTISSASKFAVAVSELKYKLLPVNVNTVIAIIQNNAKIKKSNHKF